MDSNSEDVLSQPLPGRARGQTTPGEEEARSRVSLPLIIVTCLAGILFPGLGHVVVGRWGRASMFAIAIVSMFLIGVFWLEGHFYLPSLGEPLSLFPCLANAGLGGLYGLCYFLNFGFDANAAAPTYEFGNTMLFGAGLLNYLVILDAFDLAMGRKD